MRISDWSSDVCSSDLMPVKSIVLAKIHVGPIAKHHGRASLAVAVNEKHAISPNCKVLSRVQRQGRLCDAPLEVRNRNDRGRVGCRSPGPRSEYLAHLVEFLERIMHPMPRSGTAPLGQAAIPFGFSDGRSRPTEDRKSTRLNSSH